MKSSWSDIKPRQHRSIRITCAVARRRFALKAITEVLIRRTTVFKTPMPLFVWSCKFVSITTSHHSRFIRISYASQNRASISRNRNEFAVQHFRQYETENRNDHYAKFRLQLSFWCRKISKRIPTRRSQIRMVTRTVP